jgi:hypothetical protein
MRKLQEQCDIMQQRANVLETRMNDAKKAAIEAKRAGNTRAAMLKMKQFKQAEQDLVKLDGQMLMLEQQRGIIESSHFDQQVFAGLKTGKEAVEKMQEKLDVDEMMDLQDELLEQQEKQKEMSDFFVKQAQDQTEGLMDELDAWEAEEAEKEMMMEPVAVGTIKVSGQAQAHPSQASKSKAQSIEDELEAMMA